MDTHHPDKPLQGPKPQIPPPVPPQPFQAPPATRAPMPPYVQKSRGLSTRDIETGGQGYATGPTGAKRISVTDILPTDAHRPMLGPPMPPAPPAPPTAAAVDEVRDIIDASGGPTDAVLRDLEAQGVPIAVIRAALQPPATRARAFPRLAAVQVGEELVDGTSYPRIEWNGAPYLNRTYHYVRIHNGARGAAMRIRDENGLPVSNFPDVPFCSTIFLPAGWTAF